MRQTGLTVMNVYYASCCRQEGQSLTERSGYRKFLETSGPLDLHRFRYTPTHGFVVLQSLARGPPDCIQSQRCQY